MSRPKCKPITASASITFHLFSRDLIFPHLSLDDHKRLEVVLGVMKNICPFAPYTINAEISNLDDTLAIVTLNEIWQAQGCKSTQPDEMKMLGDYC